MGLDFWPIPPSLTVLLQETMRAATSGTVPPLLILVGQEPHHSMDWFKGTELQETPHISRENRWFPVGIPFSQSIETQRFLHWAEKCMSGCVWLKLWHTQKWQFSWENKDFYIFLPVDGLLDTADTIRYPVFRHGAMLRMQWGSL